MRTAAAQTTHTSFRQLAHTQQDAITPSSQQVSRQQQAQQCS
jgi:hypothetical protein